MDDRVERLNKLLGEVGLTITVSIVRFLRRLIIDLRVERISRILDELVDARLYEHEVIP